MIGIGRDKDKYEGVVNYSKEKQFTIAAVLFVTGGVILICSLLFSVYTVFTYFTVYNKFTSLGLLIGSLVALGGVYLSFVSFGISRIIEQNREIIGRLKDMEEMICNKGKGD